MQVPLREAASAGQAARRHIADLKRLDPRLPGRFRLQLGNKPVHRLRIAFRFDHHTQRRVADKTGEPQSRRMAIDRRPESDPLDAARDLYSYALGFQRDFFSTLYACHAFSAVRPPSFPVRQVIT